MRVWLVFHRAARFGGVWQVELNIIAREGAATISKQFAPLVKNLVAAGLSLTLTLMLMLLLNMEEGKTRAECADAAMPGVKADSSEMERMLKSAREALGELVRARAKHLCAPAR